MALEIKHNIIGSIDGSYIIIQATNPQSDYVDEGIDIDNDIYILEIERLYLPDEESFYAYVIDPGGSEGKQFLTTGLKLYPSDFGISNSNAFIDGKYTTWVTVYVDVAEGDYTSKAESVLYGITEQKSLKYIFDTDWKSIYRDISIYFDNSLKIKSWLSNIKYANDFNLISEGERILKSLQKALS